MEHGFTPAPASAAFRAGRRRAGFTLIEMLLVVVMLGILSVLIIPMVSRLTAREKVSEAAAIVQHDLERAFSTAARLRRAVVLTADNSALIYQVTDQVGGTLRLTRRLNATQDASVQTMTFSPATITFQPNGIASAALTVTLTSGGATRVVEMTRVGLIRRTQ